LKIIYKSTEYSLKKDLKKLIIFWKEFEENVREFIFVNSCISDAHSIGSVLFSAVLKAVISSYAF